MSDSLHDDDAAQGPFFLDLFGAYDEATFVARKNELLSETMAKFFDVDRGVSCLRSAYARARGWAALCAHYVLPWLVSAPPLGSLPLFQMR